MVDYLRLYKDEIREAKLKLASGEMTPDDKKKFKNKARTLRNIIEIEMADKLGGLA